MKVLRIIGLALLGLAVLIVLGTLAVGAQGPVTFNAPVNAPYIDTQVHTLNGNQPALYRFDYVIPDPTSRPFPLTTIRLPNGLNSGLNFEVWTVDEITDVVNNHPVGRGSPERIRCDVTETNPEGWCTTGDMIWIGAFGASGAYYVRVLPSTLYMPNPNTNIASPPNTSGSSSSSNSSSTGSASGGAISYKLIITGDGVQLGGSPIAVTGPQATSTAASSSSSASSSSASSTETTTPTPTTPASSGATSSASSSATETPAATPTSTTSGTTSSGSSNASSTSSTSQVNPTYIDNQAHTLQANSDAWYKFDYTVSDPANPPTVTLTLVNGSKAGAQFEVWTPDAFKDIKNNQPTARGALCTATASSSSSSASSASSASSMASSNAGACSSNDLMWSGTFNTSGTYYVHVINPTSSSVDVTLMVAGSGVSLGSNPVPVTGSSSSASSESSASSSAMSSASSTYSASSSSSP